MMIWDMTYEIREWGMRYEDSNSEIPMEHYFTGVV